MTFDYHAAMTEGHTFNEMVAQRLRDAGIGCTVPELELVTKDEDIRRLTKEEKDIILDNGLVLEVKSRNLGFSEDPAVFWQSNIYVDTASGYEAKEVKPYAYVMVSQKSGNMLVVHSNTKEHWFKHTTQDPYRKITETFYKVDKKHLTTWYSLVEELLQRK